MGNGESSAVCVVCPCNMEYSLMHAKCNAYQQRTPVQYLHFFQSLVVVVGY